MIKPLEQWLEEDVAKVKSKSVKFLSEFYFHREVQFPRKINNEMMYCPASGTIINVQESISPDETMIEVKGIKYSLNEAYGENIDLDQEAKYLVIDIFLSFYDEHFQSIPYSGNIYSEELAPIQSTNLPMLAVEKELINGIVNPEARMDYLMDNGRMLNTIYSPRLGQEYYVIQISDFDVSKILNYKEGEGEHVAQTERFGKITLGSEVTLIVKHSDDFDMELVKGVEVGNHIDRNDSLIKINWK